MSSKPKARLATRAKAEAAHHALVAENYSLGSPDFAQPPLRVGRPIKTARRGRKYHIGVIVTGETKNIIARQARNSGRTISREVEHLVEQALFMNRMLGALGMSLEDFERAARNNVERSK